MRYCIIFYYNNTPSPISKPMVIPYKKGQDIWLGLVDCRFLILHFNLIILLSIRSERRISPKTTGPNLSYFDSRLMGHVDPTSHAKINQPKGQQ